MRRPEDAGFTRLCLNIVRDALWPPPTSWSELVVRLKVIRAFGRPALLGWLEERVDRILA